MHNRKMRNKKPLLTFANLCKALLTIFSFAKTFFSKLLRKTVVGLNTNFRVCIACRIKKQLWAAGSGQSWPPRPPATWLQHLRPEQQQAEASALFQPLAFYTSAGPTEDKM